MKPSENASPSATDPWIGFFRHGPAGKADAVKFPDDDLRPLTAKGRKAVKRGGRGLAAAGFRPSLILTSPVRRALETAELLRAVFKLPPSSLRAEGFLHYQSPVRAAWNRLRRFKPSGPILLVGHEPWLGECVALCVTGKKNGNFPLRKAGFAAVAVREWAPGGGSLIAFAPPEFLEALA